MAAVKNADARISFIEPEQAVAWKLSSPSAHPPHCVHLPFVSQARRANVPIFSLITWDVADALPIPHGPSAVPRKGVEGCVRVDVHEEHDCEEGQIRQLGSRSHRETGRLRANRTLKSLKLSGGKTYNLLKTSIQASRCRTSLVHPSLVVVSDHVVCLKRLYDMPSLCFRLKKLHVISRSSFPSHHNNSPFLREAGS